MNDREQLTKMYNDGHNDGYEDGYNEAISLHCKGSDQNNSDMYSEGYDEGYAQAKSEINHQLERLKIQLEEAEQFQAFWRECYHIEHNKLILAEDKLKRTETQSS